MKYSSEVNSDSIIKSQNLKIKEEKKEARSNIAWGIALIVMAGAVLAGSFLLEKSRVIKRPKTKNLGVRCDE